MRHISLAVATLRELELGIVHFASWTRQASLLSYSTLGGVMTIWATIASLLIQVEVLILGTLDALCLICIRHSCQTLLALSIHG